MQYYEKKTTVIFKDHQQKTLFTSKLAALPIRGESLRDKCIELYANDNPCIMKQTAVMYRFYAQLDDWVEQAVSDCQDKQDFLWSDIPVDIRHWIDLPVEIITNVRQVQIIN